MYSGKDDSRFTRRNAGQKFEFSTAGGKFILIAEMDGDSTLKPVLRVSLIPKDESLLGSNIRYGIFSKGQLISKCSFGVFKSPKKNQRNFFQDFCPSL